MTPPVPSQVQATFADMFGQSLAVLSRPSPATFERFERRGSVKQAFTYVMLAALVSAVIAAFFAIFHQDVTLIGQFVTRLLLVPLKFAVFTGAVYLIGKTLFKGTGTYPEVAYTFALFFVPLSIVDTLLGIIPVLNWITNPLISLVMMFFGFLAVQSSVNLRDSTSAAVTLVLAGIAHWAVGAFLTALILSPFR